MAMPMAESLQAPMLNIGGVGCFHSQHFMQNFEYYMTVEVLEPNWHTMEAKLRTAVTVDEVRHGSR
jgi:hypothetical protein